MKLHPIRDCMARADEIIEKYGAEVFQQWLCAHCGAKQTMETPNAFFAAGVCEECGKETDIEADGCNYAVHLALRRRKA